jgi:hypothetical protein
MTANGLRSCPDKGNSYLYKMMQLPPNGMFYIALIRLCSNLQSTGVKKVVVSMQELFDRMIAYDEDLVEIVTRAKKELQMEYIEHYGKRFSKIIESYVEGTPGGSGEPVDIS